jgi:hypothetical protein
MCNYVENVLWRYECCDQLEWLIEQVSRDFPSGFSEEIAASIFQVCREREIVSVTVDRSLILNGFTVINSRGRSAR